MTDDMEDMLNAGQGYIGMPLRADFSKRPEPNLNNKELAELRKKLSDQTYELSTAHKQYKEVRKENEVCKQVLMDRGYAFQKAQNKTLLENHDLRTENKSLADAVLEMTEAFAKSTNYGHNDDCILCGLKDREAKAVLARRAPLIERLKK